MPLILNDTLTDTADLSLTAHTSESGHAWNIWEGRGYHAKIRHMGALQVAHTMEGADSHLFSTATFDVPDVEVVFAAAISGTLPNRTYLPNDVGVYARMVLVHAADGTWTRDRYNGYRASFRWGGGTNGIWEIIRIHSDPNTAVTPGNIETVIASSEVNVLLPSDSTAPRTFKFVITGSGTTVNLRLSEGSTEIINYNDTHADRVTTTGKVGIYIAAYNSGNSGMVDSITASTITEAGANAAPTFPGPNIADINATQNSAMVSDTVSDSFSDDDALTFSAIGTWPAGIVVTSAGVIQGTPTATGTFTGLKVRATDTASQTVDSNAFTITASAPGAVVLAGANSSQANGSSTGAITLSSLVTLTSSAMKSFFTGLVRASETGIAILVYDTSASDSGELVTKLIGQSSNGSGIWTGQIAGTAGHAYRLIYKFADGSEGMETVIAA